MSHQIAIDGPAGAGKSTVAKAVAKKLGWIYADTGAMYRAIALNCIRNGVKSENEAAVNKVAAESNVELAYGEEGQIVLLNGESVNAFIRTEEVSAMTSSISVYPEVREKLTQLQKTLAEKNDVVMDGRDIGTSVLPYAICKIYLTAGSRERAKRRFLEYEVKGINADIDEIEKDIIERDERDMNREISPLRKADDAHVVDSSFMTADEVIEEILKIYKKCAE